MAQEVTDTTESRDTRKTKPAEFIGTPLEVECYIRRFYDLCESFMDGYAGNTDADGNQISGELHDALSDAFERTVWKVTLEQQDKLAKSQVRVEWLVDAELMKSERFVSKSIYEALSSEDSKAGSTEDDTAEL